MPTIRLQISPTNKPRILGVILSALLVALAIGAPFLSSVSALQLQNREVRISNSSVSATSNYRFSFDTASSSNIGSIRFQLCSNSPLQNEPCTAPTGLDVSGATLLAQSGMTGFTISPLTTANELILTRTSAAATPVAVAYEFSDITNPTSIGTYFGRIETFTSEDITGLAVDFGGLAFQINGGLTLQTEVPPYLLFCSGITIQAYDCDTATGSYIDFGDFSPSITNTGTTQLLVGTNAEFGYTLRVTGTTLTSGINTINQLASPDVSKRGQSQFGMNLRANGTPPVGANVQGPGAATVAVGYNQPNFYQFNNGDIVASSVSTDAYRMFTASYVVNVSQNQAPGYYVATLVYIALASF